MLLLLFCFVKTKGIACLYANLKMEEILKIVGREERFNAATSFGKVRLKCNVQVRGNRWTLEGKLESENKDFRVPDLKRPVLKSRAW